eukprot:scaffold2222_cov28-Tisochrysis_lutea.AAC.1
MTRSAALRPLFARLADHFLPLFAPSQSLSARAQSSRCASGRSHGGAVQLGAHWQGGTTGHMRDRPQNYCYGDAGLHGPVGGPAAGAAPCARGAAGCARGEPLRLAPPSQL